MSPLLHVDSLCVSYVGNEVLNIANFSIDSGEIVGIVGANGAGKTTLVNAIAGWSRSSPQVRAHIQFAGATVSELAAHERARRGLLLVPESKLVYSSLSVQDNLASPSFALSTENKGRRYTRAEVYQLFPRLEERRSHLGSELSGGERQMLGIGRALMLGPQLLVVDEPSIGLSPLLTQQVLATMRQLADEGIAVLVAEQNVRAAVQVVDRMVVLERGAIALQGPTEVLRNDPRVAQAYLGVEAA
ncbi:ABC transporter ATP-binding protein [Bordetella genomosp. 1]|uniref:ABC transporter ATP-binding protein n=1 Tax=Bordetella genomosp. 1 TaxID=1395607 RepID=A0A261S8B4_9BORD|nr:ABC transporter ATP-binding protein [Bordetella genomosp. 1]OZI33192.1 ABC transporter ATP-binding protein [Bordetella genomosp. 1]